MDFGGTQGQWHPVEHKPWAISPCLDEDSEAKVSIFIDQESHLWREDVLKKYLVDFEVKIVKSIPLCRTQQGNILTWPQNPNGEYTVKSGYKFLQTKFQSQQPGPSDSGTLKTFLQANWKLNIPSKVKNLVGEHVVILYLGK